MVDEEAEPAAFGHVEGGAHFAEGLECLAELVVDFIFDAGF